LLLFFLGERKEEGERQEGWREKKVENGGREPVFVAHRGLFCYTNKLDY
jgi:hypothetical protein